MKNTAVQKVAVKTTTFICKMWRFKNYRIIM